MHWLLLAVVAACILASWSGTGFVQPGPPEEVMEQVEQITCTGGPDCKEQEDAIMAAKTAATNLIVSGAMGDPTEHGFRVQLAGHSNPDNTAEPGWSPDAIVVNVSQSKESPIPKDQVT